MGRFLLATLALALPGGSRAGGPRGGLAGKRMLHISGCTMRQALASSLQCLHCASDAPCSRCQGWCRNNAECAGDLKCFLSDTPAAHPSGDLQVPGCDTGRLAGSKWVSRSSAARGQAGFCYDMKCPVMVLLQGDNQHHEERHPNGELVNCATVDSPSTGFHIGRANQCVKGEWADAGTCPNAFDSMVQGLMFVIPAVILGVGCMMNARNKRQLAALEEELEGAPAGSFWVAQDVLQAAAAAQDGVASSSPRLLSAPPQHSIAASGWAVGQCIDVDTEDGVERGAVILGAGDGPDEMQVRFVDGQRDSWPVADFRLRPGALWAAESARLRRAGTQTEASTVSAVHVPPPTLPVAHYVPPVPTVVVAGVVVQGQFAEEAFHGEPVAGLVHVHGDTDGGTASSSLPGASTCRREQAQAVNAVEDFI